MTKLSILKLGFLVLVSAAIVWSTVRLKMAKRLDRAAKTLLVLVFLGCLVILDAYWIEPNWIQVRRVTIGSEPLTAKLSGIKIVHLSDLHLQNGIGFRERALVRKVNRLEPDLILLTGDYLDDLTQIEDCIRLLSQLKAKVGIIGVPGNTDHLVMDANRLRRELARAGVAILVNESKAVNLPNGKRIFIAGVDEPVNHRDDLRRAISLIPEEEPFLLLAHSPDIYKEAVRARADLVLAGHTHGGQIGITPLVRLSNYANRTPYMAGIFRDGKTILYVNRGIGTKTIGARFLCRPEITVLEFR